eukprot:g59009.t1
MSKQPPLVRQVPRESTNIFLNNYSEQYQLENESKGRIFEFSDRKMHPAVTGFALCGLSALLGTFVVARRYVIPPISDLPHAQAAMGASRLGFLRTACFAGFYTLAVGTVLDNFRLFSGGLDSSFPPAVVACSTADEANALVAAGQADMAYGYMEAWTWLCYALHEMGGFVMAAAGFYLWAAGSNLPGCWGPSVLRMQGKAYMLSQCNQGIFWWSILVVLQTAFAMLGVVGFFKNTISQGLKLRYYEDLSVWRLKPVAHNDLGRLGVLYATLAWILVGFVLWRRHRSVGPWFFVVQLLVLGGQKGAGFFPTYQPILSNVLEQAALWSLVGLGVQLSVLLAAKRASSPPEQPSANGTDYMALDDQSDQQGQS